MNSIRRRLLAGLLGGFAGLWLLAGAGGYLVLRLSLQARFDAELDVLLTEVQYVMPEGRWRQPARLSPRWMDFLTVDSGLYFEIWDQDFLFPDRSASLGGGDLPLPPGLSPRPLHWNATRPSGERIRLAAVETRLGPDPAASDGSAVVVVAQDRDELERAFSLILLCFGLTSLGAVLLGFLLVQAVTRVALRPLRELGAAVARIDAMSLSARVDGTGAPQEIAPVIERLNELLARLEMSFERERRFSGNLAHELRTPVAELRAMAGLCRQWPEEAKADTFREFEGIARDMQEIIDGLLEVARQDGPPDPGAEWVDLTACVRRAWAERAGPERRERRTCTIEIADGARVSGREPLFRRIVVNLLDNALSYSPPDGRLFVRLVPDPAWAGWRLEVGNSAPDFRPENLPRLFEWLWRADDARSDRAHHGLGLGLARACARSLGWNLEAAWDSDARILWFHLFRASAQPGEKQ